MLMKLDRRLTTATVDSNLEYFPADRRAEARGVPLRERTRVCDRAQAAAVGLKDNIISVFRKASVSFNVMFGPALVLRAAALH